MTKAQEVAIKKIERLVHEDMYSEDHEIKIWDINDCGSFISLVVEYGLKGDEGTLACLIARTRAHLFIGKRGGVTYPVWSKGRQVCRQFKGYSILQAALDQK